MRVKSVPLCIGGPDVYKLLPCFMCGTYAHREVNDPQRDLVDPAVKGTRNVVQAAAKSKDTVKRVVVTSSFAGAQRYVTTVQAPALGISYLE